MKKLLLIITLITLSVTSQAQTSVDSINWQLRALFANLAKPTPPRLFNWDMAVHSVDSRLFIPINYADTISIDNWYEMYTEMRNSAYDTIPIITADSIINRCYLFGPDTINVASMYYDYYRFKPDAMTTNIYFDFDTVNNILTDKVVRPGFPYDTFKVFAASPITNTAKRNQVIFRFAPDNTFFDNFNPLDANAANSGTIMRVNFNEGTGWHNITLGQECLIPIYFANAGEYPIEVQVIHDLDPYPDTVAHSISLLKIKKTRAAPYDDPDDRLHMFGMNINQYNPCDMTQPQFLKTFIYLEGYDPADFLSFSGRDAQSIYEDQIVDNNLSDLRNFGYRIFVVDWQNSRIDMRDNARNVNDFIEYLKCGNIIGDNNDEEFVIMGESMGGIIANYALMQQENNQYTSHCKSRKLHNTRLLITLDSPFEGAHVPMGLQKMAEYISTHFTGALSIPFLPLVFKQYFKSHDLLNDGTAAKQLVSHHISTESILGPHTYYPHNKRNSFVADENSMGKHPKYCKLVAASNGNMMGFGQTRYWDGQPRTAGDHLLKAENTLYGTILGYKLNLAGVNMEMNTDPSGIGQIGKLNFGTWSIKIKLKWFGLKFTTGFNSICNKIWDADMLPTSTSAGGLLEYSTTIENSFLRSKTHQVGTGDWTTTPGTKWGKDEFVRTDGFHWCFVPVTSAFDYGTSLNVPFDILNMNTVFNLMPNHVFYGVPGSTQRQSFNMINQFWRNAYIRNDDHVDVRNDTLEFNESIANALNYIEYPFNCPPAGGNMIRNIHMLNREIGDNELWLDNRHLPWQATCSINERINVNINSPYYRYVGLPVGIQARESAYSNKKPYIIGTLGFNAFTTNTGSVNYLPPMSGPYSTPIYTVVPCCENYLKQVNSSSNSATEMKPKPDATIFPNPTNRDFILNFTPFNKGELHYQLFDMVGKMVYENRVQVQDKNVSYFLPIQLPFSLPLGQYILRTTLNEQLFSNKLIIQ